MTGLLLVFAPAAAAPAEKPVDDSAVLVVHDGKTPVSARRLAKQIVASRGWHEGTQWRCLRLLWAHESGWRYQAKNPTSSARGIPQLLKLPKGLSPEQQIRRGVKYVIHRYGSPCKAWKFWRANAWY